MEKEEILKKKEIIRNYRNNDLLNKIIEEFCFRFKGQITREEVEKILKNNGFDGLYLLSEEDFFQVNEDGGKEITSAGTYVASLKCITLREKFIENIIEIGCHELTHALIDGKLSYVVKCCEWEASYGLGLEEGVATAVEKMQGSVNKSSNNTNQFGYKRNHTIISELDLLYQRSKYKKYDSITVEAIKHPDIFFNLIYRIVLDTIKGIYFKAKDKISIEEAKMIALRCSFVILQSTDMLIEFRGKDASVVDKDVTLTAYGYTKFIIGCLLSSIDDNIKNGVILPQYIGPFTADDLKLFKLKEEENLLIALFGSDATYYHKLAAYINSILVEYVLKVEYIKNDVDSRLVKKQP